MNELQELYREVILDHNRHPRNFGEMDAADRVIDGVNPLCGDKLTLYLKLNGDLISDVSFRGTGCAISVASASLMTDKVKGLPVEEALALFEQIHDMLTSSTNESPPAQLEKLAALAGVRDYPSRVKCASLAWHALSTALSGADQQVSTE